LTNKEHEPIRKNNEFGDKSKDQTQTRDSPKSKQEGVDHFPCFKANLVQTIEVPALQEPILNKFERSISDCSVAYNVWSFKDRTWTSVSLE